MGPLVAAPSAESRPNKRVRDGVCHVQVAGGGRADQIRGGENGADCNLQDGAWIKNDEEADKNKFAQHFHELPPIGHCLVLSVKEFD